MMVIKTAARLAQSAGLLSGRSRVQTPARPPTRVFKMTGKIMLTVIKDLVSVQMIASLGGDVKPLALSPSYFLINWKRT